jgi:hypothetical protein
MEIRPVEAELFRADGQIDMKLIVAFRNFGNAPKNRLCLNKPINWHNDNVLG